MTATVEFNCAYQKLVPVKDLKPHPKNANQHSKDQIDRLAKNILNLGFRHPIIVSKLTGFIVAGHARLAAAKHLKLKEVPVDYQDFDNLESEYAFLISDNALAEFWSSTDLSLVNAEMENLGPDFDLDLLGIKDFKLDLIEKIPECDEDEIPEKVEPKTKLGDLYILGEHRLLCGDSTNIQSVEKLMGGQKADMVFTDPPYGMKLDADYSKMPVSPTGAKPKKWDNIAGDHDDFSSELIQTMLGIFSYCDEIFLCGADYFAELIPEKNLGSWYVWDKRVTENFDRMIGSAFELIWSKKKHKREIARINNTLYSGEPDAINKVHPTQKPIKLIEWIFERASGVLVVDLFGGSGSTMIACEKTNRKCFMSELDPKYVDIIVQRWMKYTGKMAYLVEDSTGKIKEPVPFVELNSFRGVSMLEESKSIAQKNAGRFVGHTEI